MTAVIGLICHVTGGGIAHWSRVDYWAQTRAHHHKEMTADDWSFTTRSKTVRDRVGGKNATLSITLWFVQFVCTTPGTTWASIFLSQNDG